VKQGGIIKNWKRRFWILSGMALYYFVSPAVRSPLPSLPPSLSFSFHPDQGSSAETSSPRFLISISIITFFFEKQKSEEPQGVIQLKGASVALNNGTFPSSVQPKCVTAPQSLLLPFSFLSRYSPEHVRVRSCRVSCAVCRVCGCVRRYVFAIDTPSRRYYVEADNQLEFDSWVDAIQSAIRGKVRTFFTHLRHLHHHLLPQGPLLCAL
jgi:hypothetical protein